MERQEKHEEDLPAISGFTVSALSGNIEAEVSFSSTGDGEIIQCEVMLGKLEAKDFLYKIQEEELYVLELFCR